MTNGDVELIDENNIHKLLIRPLKGFFCEGGGVFAGMLREYVPTRK